MRLNGVERARDQVLPFLRMAIVSRGIEINSNGFFKCPAHDEEKASAHFIPDSKEQAWYCFGCLWEGELIWTASGLKPISDIRVGDVVLDSQGQSQTVSAVEHKEGQLIEIGTRAFRRDPLRLTPDHTCLYVTKANALRSLKYLCRATERSEGLRYFGIRKNRIREHNWKVSPIVVTEGRADSLCLGDFLLFPVLKDRVARELSAPDIIKPYTKGPKSFRLESLPASIKAARLYGLYLAEGSTGKRHVVFTYNLNEKDTLAAETSQILKDEFGLVSSVTEYPDKNTCEVHCCKTDLTRQLEHWFGKGAAEKTIPVTILSWPVDLQRALIKGYQDGDGSKGRGDASTVAQELAYGLFALFIQAGYCPSLRHRESRIDRLGVNHRECWYVSRRPNEGLPGFFQEIDGQQYYWSPVSSINNLGTATFPVVDISVDNSQSFLTKLGAVHNCNSGGNIFDLVHYTDDLPLSGPGWLNVTLRKLCEEFGIEYNIDEQALTPEERQEQEVYRAYEKASQIIVDGKHPAAVEAKLLEYGWSKKTLRIHGIGSVFSTTKFINTMTKVGFSKDFLEDIGLLDRRIFRPECLIFTVKDAIGRPVGFAARYLNYEADQKQIEDLAEENPEECAKLQRATQPKYVNTDSKKNPLYQKRVLLYGYHASRKTSKSIWLFEGNADVVTAQDRGLINSGAICGSNFSEELFKLLLEDGFNHFIFVMDGDKGGREASDRIVALCQSFLADKPDIRVELIDLPTPEGEKKIDPDLMIRVHGLSRLLKLPRRSYHYWGWVSALRLQDSVTVAQEAFQQMLKQPSGLVRWEMLETLHELTNIPKAFIWESFIQTARRVETPIARDVLASVRWMQIMQDREDLAKAAIETAKAEEVASLDVDLAAIPLVGFQPLLEPETKEDSGPVQTLEEMNREAADDW